MSQERPRKPPAVEQQEPIKYGDIFPVSGELSSQPVAPGDAAMMQSAETSVLGKTLKGGTAAVMQSAATRNERAGVVGHRDVTKVVENEGATLVGSTDLPGTRVITESVAKQVIGQHVQPHP
ncbi:late embryogenesis abundant protein D-34-like [Primulina eburnea]|uniref:late embryogenesis abundant protein D-34-like n=1 Tax=Primulina eburnea TaxID=1245227 RepID=UPI003C6C8516